MPPGTSRPARAIEEGPLGPLGPAGSAALPVLVVNRGTERRSVAASGLSVTVNPPADFKLRSCWTVPLILESLRDLPSSGGWWVLDRPVRQAVATCLVPCFPVCYEARPRDAVRPLQSQGLGQR